MINWGAIIAIASFFLSAYSVFIITKVKSDRSEKDIAEILVNHETFSKEIKTYLTNLDMSFREHTVIHQVTTTTLASLVTRLEGINTLVNKHDITLAVIQDRENRKESNGR